MTLLHHFDKLIEQIGAVLRTGRTLRMILDAENPIGAAFDAFGGIVQQIQVRKGQSGALQRLRIDRKAVLAETDIAGDGERLSALRPAQAA